MPAPAATHPTDPTADVVTRLGALHAWLAAHRAALPASYSVTVNNGAARILVYTDAGDDLARITRVWALAGLLDARTGSTAYVHAPDCCFFDAFGTLAGQPVEITTPLRAPRAPIEGGAA